MLHVLEGELGELLLVLPVGQDVVPGADDLHHSVLAQEVLLEEGIRAEREEGEDERTMSWFFWMSWAVRLISMATISWSKACMMRRNISTMWPA